MTIKGRRQQWRIEKKKDIFKFGVPRVSKVLKVFKVLKVKN
jgi:hypothetical protein